VAVALTFVLSWLLWVMLVRRLALRTRPDPDVGGLAVLLVLVALCVLTWLSNPYEALLLLPAAHLWLVLASPELRPRRAGSVALVLAGLVPLALTLAFYSHQLGLGPGGLASTAVLLLAGGHIGIVGAVLWSAALGCVVGALLLALGSPGPAPVERSGSPVEVTIRGPLTYAGPGSLGGTESALRR
jgi:hypothetical protein